MKLCPYFRPKLKINSRFIVGLNLKGKTKFLEETIGDYFHPKLYRNPA